MNEEDPEAGRGCGTETEIRGRRFHRGRNGLQTEFGRGVRGGGGEWGGAGGGEERVGKGVETETGTGIRTEKGGEGARG